MVVFASPNALSAYHRMGLTSELEGHNLVAVTRPLISDPFEAQELASHIRESLTGGASMRMEVDAGERPCCSGRCRWWCMARRPARRC